MAPTALWARLRRQEPKPRRRGSFRTAAPRETLARITPLLPRAGITRLADITRLDWIGAPVYQAIRPNSRNISVSVGKGTSAVAAKVSAAMESLESFHAEELMVEARRDTIRNVRREIDYDPYALPLASVGLGSVRRDETYDPFAPPIGPPGALHDDVPIDWVPATDLSTGEETWAPKELCELDFTVRERLAPPFFRATSNGLASGNDEREAVLHGLFEVVERDSVIRLRENGDRQSRRVDVSTIGGSFFHSLCERLTRSGVDVHIADATGPTRLACFEAHLVDPTTGPVYHGAGCHASRSTAVVRALTEAAQGRVGHFAGSRDDFARRHYDRPAMARGDSSDARRGARDFRTVPTSRIVSLVASIDDVVARVKRVTGMSPLAVDLGRPSFGLGVCFVLAPGLRLIPPRRR